MTTSLAKMPRINKNEYKCLFSDDQSKFPFHDSDECPHADQMTDELGIPEDDVVPFPHELDKQLAMEKQYQFGTNILVDFAVGSGEKEIAFLFVLNLGPGGKGPPLPLRSLPHCHPQGFLN